MAYHKEEKREVKEVVVSTKEWHTCDFCGDKLEEYTHVKKTGVIRWRVKESYLYGGCEHVQAVDSCEKCYKSVILPWLDSLKITPYEREYDW